MWIPRCRTSAQLYRVGGSSHISWYFLPWVGRWRGWLAGGGWCVYGVPFCVVVLYFCQSLVMVPWWCCASPRPRSPPRCPCTPPAAPRSAAGCPCWRGEGVLGVFSVRELETRQRRGGGEFVVVVLGLPWCRSVAQHPGGPGSPAEHRGQLGELRLGDR